MSYESKRELLGLPGANNSHLGSSTEQLTTSTTALHMEQTPAVAHTSQPPHRREHWPASLIAIFMAIVLVLVPMPIAIWAGVATEFGEYRYDRNLPSSLSTGAKGILIGAVFVGLWFALSIGLLMYGSFSRFQPDSHGRPRTLTFGFILFVPATIASGVIFFMALVAGMDDSEYHTNTNTLRTLFWVMVGVFPSACVSFIVMLIVLCCCCCYRARHGTA